MQSLRIEAKWLSSEPSTSRSTASSPDIATLLEVFDEPLRDANRPALSAAKPTLPASGQRLVPREAAAQSTTAKPAAAPAATKRSDPLVKGLIAALVSIALVPLAILFVLLWQDMMRPQGAHEVAPAQPSSAQSEHVASPLEVALSSPERIEANAGEVIGFPLAIDATGPLPVRSIIAVAGLPEGAAFSAGRPYGENGWSLRPDEISDLQLRLGAESGPSALHLELVAGDGTVLARSETQVSLAVLPPVVATVDDPTIDASQPTATNTATLEQVPQAQETASSAEAPPPPDRKPSMPAATKSAVKVNTVKVVTIMPPQPTRPHDGAYALAPHEAQAPAEWMETKTAVDMHAKAQQSSETVKVAEGGVKMRVVARDKRWVQVTDPATSTTGWIYDRFLTPTDPPAPYSSQRGAASPTLEAGRAG